MSDHTEIHCKTSWFQISTTEPEFAAFVSSHVGLVFHKNIVREKPRDLTSPLITYFQLTVDHERGFFDSEDSEVIFEDIATHILEGNIVKFYESGTDMDGDIVGYSYAVNCRGESISISLEDIDDITDKHLREILLLDKGTPSNEPVKVNINLSRNGDIGLKFDGYSDCCSNNNEGIPILIELFDGEIFARIYADINKEDPTHNIKLSGARNKERLDQN